MSVLVDVAGVYVCVALVVSMGAWVVDRWLR
jgi:hypothetical protein